MLIPNEQKILACAGHIEPDENHLQKLRGYMSTVSDTGPLIDKAIKEGLAGFLYKSLLKAGLLDTLHPHHKQRLYTTYYLTIRHNLKLIHALNEILKPLIEKGVQVILMQGISLLQEVYRDIGLRPMNDLDLWVLPNQFDDLLDCLISLGFERNSLYPQTLSRGEIVLDIHTHIFWADRIKSRNLLLKKSQVEIFKNARLINVENSAALTLNPSDQFLYLSLHALKHNLERLIWLVDIKSLVANWHHSDWQALIARAEELGQESTLLYMLYVLRNIFKPKFPAEVAFYFDCWKSNLLERRILNRRVNGGPIPIWGQLALMSTGKSLRQRISFVKETLLPRPKILRQVFPHSPDLDDRRLYWKRVLQILGSIKL